MMLLLLEELSEEDQQLKSELDMLVERLLVCPSRYSRAWYESAADLENRNQILVCINLL